MKGPGSGAFWQDRASWWGVTACQRPATRRRWGLQCGALTRHKRCARTARHLPISAHAPTPAPSPGGQIILSLSQPDKITNANSIKSPLKVFNYQTAPKT